MCFNRLQEFAPRFGCDPIHVGQADGMVVQLSEPGPSTVAYRPLEGAENEFKRVTRQEHMKGFKDAPAVDIAHVSRSL